MLSVVSLSLCAVDEWIDNIKWEGRKLGKKGTVRNILALILIMGKVHVPTFPSSFSFPIFPLFCISYFLVHLVLTRVVMDVDKCRPIIISVRWLPQVSRRNRASSGAPPAVWKRQLLVVRTRFMTRQARKRRFFLGIFFFWGSIAVAVFERAVMKISVRA